ncbi:MAG: hypothetical protein LUD77_04760 [Clostridiales bacterium]|nr:hypothetical protein [Clostridiales bacterium]
MDYIDVIVKYNGSFEELTEKFAAQGEDLSLGYGIIVVPYGRIADLAGDEQVEYLELPRNLALYADCGGRGQLYNGNKGKWLKFDRQRNYFGGYRLGV